jgi:hypothetical protein
MVDSVYPDDTGKDLAVVLSYLAGRTLSKEEIWTAMGLRRSTYYDQLEKRTLITADNLSKAAANLRINRAELLTRYRFIDPEEVTSLAEKIDGWRASRSMQAGTGLLAAQEERTKVSALRPLPGAPPL